MKTDPLFPAKGARRFAPLSLALVFTLGAALALGGCASPERRTQKMMERAGPRQRPLAGQAVFFAGELEARATLGAYNAGGPGGGGSPGGGRPGSGGPQGRSGGSGFSGGLSMGGVGMGGGGMGGGPGGMGGGGGPGGGGMPGGGGGGGGMPMEGGGGRPAESMGAPMASMPRHALQVSFRNSGPADRAFTVIEVKCPLGNFAPRPERLTLAPGQTAALDAMNSVEGATFDALEVVVTLRSGDRRETQTLRLSPPEP